MQKTDRTRKQLLQEIKKLAGLPVNDNYWFNRKDQKTIIGKVNSAVRFVSDDKKKKKYVENHHDDCGEDLASLKGIEDEPSGFTNHFLCDPDYSHLFLSDSDSEDDVDHEICNTMFYGSVMIVGMLPQVYVAQDIAEAYLVANRRGPGVDIAEVCGGRSQNNPDRN